MTSSSAEMMKIFFLRVVIKPLCGFDWKPWNNISCKNSTKFLLSMWNYSDPKRFWDETETTRITFGPFNFKAAKLPTSNFRATINFSVKTTFFIPVNISLKLDYNHRAVKTIFILALKIQFNAFILF